MVTYYVMYWNDREDYPVAVFEVKAESAYENGGEDYEDDWPLLTETDLTEDEVKQYKDSVYTDYFKLN